LGEIPEEITAKPLQKLMIYQKIPNSQSNLDKEKQSWRTQAL